MKMREERTSVPLFTSFIHNNRIILIVFFTIWFAFESYGAFRAFSLEWDEGVFLQISLQHARGQALYTDLFLTQPPLLVEMLSLLVKVFGNSVFAARSSIIIFGFFTNVATYLIARELFNERVALVACLLAGINFYLFQQSKVVQTDMPSLTLSLFAIYGAIRYNRSGNLLWVVLSAATFALCNAFKLLEIFFVFPLIYLLIVPVFSKARESERGVLQVLHALGLYAAVFIIVEAAALLPYDLDALIYQVFVKESDSVFRLSGRVRIIADAYVGWHPGLFIFMIAGMVSVFRLSRRIFTFFVIWICSQLTFHALMSRWLWHHHLIVLFPVFSIAAAQGIVSFVNRYRKGELKFFPRKAQKRRILNLVLLVFILLVVVPSLVGDVYLYYEYAGKGKYEEEKKLVELIKKHTEPDDLVVCDTLIPVFRANRMTYKELVDPSIKRISTGSLVENELLELKEDPKLIAFWTIRLNSFQVYYAYVREHYNLVYKSGMKRVFVRR